MAMKWPPIDWKTHFYGYLVGPGVFHVNVEMFLIIIDPGNDYSIYIYSVCFNTMFRP